MGKAEGLMVGTESGPAPINIIVLEPSQEIVTVTEHSCPLEGRLGTGTGSPWRHTSSRVAVGAVPVLSKDTTSGRKGHRLGPVKTPHNPLDSSAPLTKKGKQREVPRAKKPTSLKKVGAWLWGPASPGGAPQSPATRKACAGTWTGGWGVALAHGPWWPIWAEAAPWTLPGSAPPRPSHSGPLGQPL